MVLRGGGGAVRKITDNDLFYRQQQKLKSSWRRRHELKKVFNTSVEKVTQKYTIPNAPCLLEKPVLSTDVQTRLCLVTLPPTV